MDEFPADGRPRRPHPPVGVPEMDRGDPRLEEIAAEGEEVPRAGEVVLRKVAHAVDRLVGRKVRVQSEGIPGDPVGGAEGLHEARGNEVAVSPHRIGEHEEGGRRLGPDARKPGHEEAQRLLPRDLPELPGTARTVELERFSQPLRVVERLEPRLSPGAKLSPVDRVERVPLDLLRPPLGVPDHDAASRRALAADGGVPERLPERLVLGRDHEGDELLRQPLAAAEEGREGRRPADLQETSPVQHRASPLDVAGPAVDGDAPAAVARRGTTPWRTPAAGRRCRPCRSPGGR